MYICENQLKMSLVGKKMVGFSGFPHFTEDMYQFIGAIGEIIRENKSDVIVNFGGCYDYYYPKEKAINNILITEEMKKEIKIEIPNGYEIDKENSTFEHIVFKEIKKELPKSWECLLGIKGHYVNSASELDCSINGGYYAVSKNRNVFKTKEQASASLALAQLSQLREVYRNGWVPNWNNDCQSKFCIDFWKGDIDKSVWSTSCTFLSFQDEYTRDLFFENFKDLIEQAKPLMS